MTRTDPIGGFGGGAGFWTQLRMVEGRLVAVEKHLWIGDWMISLDEIDFGVIR